ncbi:acetyl-coenzyme-A carboxylase [Spiromyces aspiralis]|uniref:Acetyl-coenzyme-A carboxylase n=1 Tax=Spiromyces aspiralis TaxID=68401 RepID=A0ACC1HKG5_9FUNG|nr:acetyl-coenzyme-A carboxylase [Spiromyces aspiralis]
MTSIDAFVGGNSVAAATKSKVRDFVIESGGHTVITKVLIANNGIAAVKEIRSVRQWAYATFGDERAIQFVVMATPEDLRVNAEYIRMADQCVEVPGGTNNNNYANVELIVDVAERCGAHAVWAGWGHASENPLLPEKLRASKHKIVFIGPPGSSMRSLGDKISSTIVAQHANVPTLPWSGDGITETVLNADGYLEVPDSAYHAATTHNMDEGLAQAKRIGFPVMIKASEGGGGKGIRMVASEDVFPSAFYQCQSEVPGSPIFIMKLAGKSRHLEVQVLADQYGNAISLFGRDCSVQRRHQKIIEEAPVSVANPDTFAEMERAAVRLAKLVGYVSAGTVEYLYSPNEDKFYFLELNPRLQVEHPTTEMVSRVNLPAAQLQVAMGIPLHRNRDIRLFYGLDPKLDTKIDFDAIAHQPPNSPSRPHPKGHVVAVRITAENPEAGFKPSSGMMQSLNFRSSTNVWGYFSVASSGGLHEFADSQFGHIFAYGDDRNSARQAMVVALKELSIRGDFRTTVEYLVTLLETRDFQQNNFNTGWLDQLISARLKAERPDTNIVVVCGAIVKAHQEAVRMLSEYKAAAEKGQAPNRKLLKNSHQVEFIYEGIRYRFFATKVSPHSYMLFLNGSKVLAEVHELTDGGLLVLFGGQSHTCYTRDEVGSVRLVMDDHTVLLEDECDPTQLRSPSPGKLARFLVESGDHVKGGQAYAEIEVMKMYMPLVASEDGIVQFVKQPGSTLAPGEVLGVLTLDDPTRVKHAKVFEGQLPAYGPPQDRGNKPHQRYRQLREFMDNVLNGYDDCANTQSSLKEFCQLLRNHELPFLQLGDIMSALKGRIPPTVEAALRQEIEEATHLGFGFPAKNMLRHIETFLLNAPPSEVPTFTNQVVPITQLLEEYREGLDQHERDVFVSLLNKYYELESVFSEAGSEEGGFNRLRERYRSDPDQLLTSMISHAGLHQKSKLVLAIMDCIHPVSRTTGALDKTYEEILKKLAELNTPHTSKVSLKARELLIQCQIPSREERERQMENILRSAVTETVYGSGVEYRTPSYDAIKNLIVTNYYVVDVLQGFFYHENPWIRLAALETYVRRAYHMYNIVDFDYHTQMGDPFMIHWRFILEEDSAILADGYSAGSRSHMKRIMSVSDINFAVEDLPSAGAGYSRQGAMGSFDTFDDLTANFDKLLRLIDLNSSEPVSRANSPGGLALGGLGGMTPLSPTGAPLSSSSSSGTRGSRSQLPKIKNVLNVALKVPQDDPFDDEVWSGRLLEFTRAHTAQLREHGVRRVTYVLLRAGQHPGTFTYRESEDYGEDATIRHIEPGLAYQLELPRLSNFDIKPCFSENRHLHIYHGVSKQNASDSRLFVRVLVRPGRLRTSLQTVDYLISESDRLLNDILDALEILTAEYPNCDCNHLFISFLPVFNLDASQFEPAYRGFLERHGKRLFRLRITAAEIRFMVQLNANDEHATPVRFCITNKSRFTPKLESYIEVQDGNTGEWKFQSLDIPAGSLHGQPVNTLYQPKEWLQPKRYKAHVMGTTYVYDFPDLFLQAVELQWRRVKKYNPAAKQPSVLFAAQELVWNDEAGGLVECNREPGRNTCGMVAWVFTFFTPEAPKEGRKAVVIANDITYKIGSFGVEEDEFFYHATEYARQHGLPRIYLSANSGARIGLAEEVREVFYPAWVDPSDPTKGFDYLYLTDADAGKLKARYGELPVITEPVVTESGETRHRITAVIGASDGLGVENLRGSGLIAGATSRAYQDIFTVTLVTCRSVGIGAYLVRLGQRAVQNEGQPIILTGAQALNKVLGREVYTSNLQLGGTQIMYKNGVSHLTAENDFSGITKILRWLSYVPTRRDAPLYISPLLQYDPVERFVEYMPPRGPSDPRNFLAGIETDSQWVSGFFDHGSFVETLGGWARTVVVGRARLGGIPVGVVSVESRTVENIIPADPANPKSEEQILSEAGMVWYPNSAYKTAQAINDFNNGEQLPLMIFANWRGFSGGQHDMFNEILKYGSYIVDALSSYRQPVFIYVIPNGELRGGAWVVLDPTINSDMMEMYADNESRAGVLEPEGIVEIKFRKPQMIAAMERLDDTFRDLKQALANPDLSPEQKDEYTTRLEQRQKQLLPIYSQIAVQFADLHDRSGRMKAKCVIRKELEWKSSRTYFYYRLYRRMLEEDVRRRIRAAYPQIDRQQQTQHLINQYVRAGHTEEDWELQDAAVAAWFEASADEIVDSVEPGSTDADVECLVKAFESLSPEHKQRLLEKLRA